MQSTGDTTLQAAKITGNTLAMNVGSTLNIDAAIESQNQSHSSKGNDLMTQNSSGSGSNTQSLNYTTINLQDAQGNHQNPILNAANGIVIGARLLPSMGTSSGSGGAPSPTITVDLKQQAAQLATQPGLSYLGELTKRHDVTWQKVQLASQSWNYSQSGLSQSGGIIIAIAVAAVTAGSSAELSAAMIADAGLTGTAATAASAALAAGMTSLASQAAVDLANNQGDLGKTLQVLGSNSAIRNTVAAMVTAGALTELGNTTTFTGQSGSGSLVNSTSGVATNQALNQFGQNLLNNVTNNLAGTVINSAITGKGLNESSLQTALTSALITAGMAQAANSIGDATQSGALNTYTQAVAHAIAGCAGGAAAAGNGGGCGAGAIGAAVGELSAQYASSSGMTDANSLALAKVMSATAGLLVSNGDPAAVNVAATMGANAAANNWAAHLGLAGGITIPKININLAFGAGLVVDGSGNFGLYGNYPNGGVSTGGSGSLGISAGVYPGASTIQNYTGPFNNVSVGAGSGGYIGVDVFQDASKSAFSPSSYGVGATIGVGVGSGASATRTNTTVCALQSGKFVCQ